MGKEAALVIATRGAERDKEVGLDIPPAWRWRWDYIWDRCTGQ